MIDNLSCPKCLPFHLSNFAPNAKCGKAPRPFPFPRPQLLPHRTDRPLSRLLLNQLWHGLARHRLLRRLLLLFGRFGVRGSLEKFLKRRELISKSRIEEALNVRLLKVWSE